MFLHVHMPPPTPAGVPVYSKSPFSQEAPTPVRDTRCAAAATLQLRRFEWVHGSRQVTIDYSVASYVPVDMLDSAAVKAIEFTVGKGRRSSPLFVTHEDKVRGHCPYSYSPLCAAVLLLVLTFVLMRADAHAAAHDFLLVLLSSFCLLTVCLTFLPLPPQPVSACMSA